MAIFTLAIVYLAWSGGQQTDALIKAAQKNDDAADKFSQSADSINKAIGGAVQDFKDMTAANETSAKAATDSSNTAKASLEVSERAYVGVLSAVMDKDLMSDQKVEIAVTIGNGVKTPAFAVRTRHYWAYFKPGTTPKSYAKVDVVSSDVLLPVV